MAEETNCDKRVIDCDDYDTKKEIGLNKSPGLGGLPYEIYLRLSSFSFFSSFFVSSDSCIQPLLCPGSHLRTCHLLLKNSSKHSWDELDDCRFISLLNTVKDSGAGLSELFANCC